MAKYINEWYYLKGDEDKECVWLLGVRVWKTGAHKKQAQKELLFEW